jgi:minor tail protein Z (GPZ)
MGLSDRSWKKNAGNIELSEEFIQIDVRDTIKETIADITAIQQGISKKAAVRAVNRAVDGVATGASREVRKIYNVRARAIAAAMKKIKTSLRGRSISGSVVFSGRNIPLIEFDARWTRTMPGASVRIKVGGPRKTLRTSFIATTGRGTRGVFVRTGKDRYPIKQLRSVSIPDTIRNQVVRTALITIGIDRFRREFLHQLDFLKAKQNGG